MLRRPGRSLVQRVEPFISAFASRVTLGRLIRARAATILIPSPALRAFAQS
jgi:hypothetical protein